MDRETRDAYDAVAPEYEARFLDELGGKSRDRELLDEFARAVGDPVLDVGCGPGQIGAYVRNSARRVIGLDLSEQMTARAATRLDSALVGDLRELPFAADSLGGVLAFYSVIHLRRDALRPALAEVGRVLRPGGTLLLSAHEGEGEVERTEFLGAPVRLRGTYFSLDELVVSAVRAGFDVVHAERRPPYPNEGATTRLYLLVEWR